MSFRSRCLKHIFLTATLALVISACSDNGNLQVDTGNNAPTSSTTEPYRFSFSSDPQETLNELAVSQSSIDQSRIADACGISNALLVQPSGLRFFRWVDSAWVEHFDIPIAESQDPPFIVTTRDYTGDGLLDFLVGYREAAPYGGILSPTGPECEWEWLTFSFTDRTTSKLVDYLAWSDDTQVLSGSWKGGLNETANLRFTFDQTRLQMVAKDDPYADPDMAWIGDTCQEETRLYSELEVYGDAINNSNGRVALDLAKQWLDAVDRAITAIQVVGPATLNLTARESYYLGDLYVPQIEYRGFGSWQWWLSQSDFIEAHDLLSSYCSMLPPRP